MKVLLKAILSIIGLAILLPALAQDSTSVAQANGFIDCLQHWPIGAKILGILWTVDQILAFIPPQVFAGNAVVHSIYLFLRSLKVPDPKVLLPLILIVGFSFSSQAQMFSPIAKPKVAKFNSFSRAAVTPFDTIPAGQSYVGFRFTGPTVMYATSFKNLKQADIFTFLGVDYEKATFDAASQKYFTDWAIGLHGGAGGQFAPNSVSAVTAVALSFGTQKIGSTKLPFKLTFGVIYNITTHQGMPAVGPGVPLNN